MYHLSSILRLFPTELAEALYKEILSEHLSPEEIRIRRGQAICIRSAQREFFSSTGIVNDRHLQHILLNATNGAFHSATEQLKNGYLPLPNGCRMGLCGEGSGGEATLRNIRSISSLCIRIAKPVQGCGDEVYTRITDGGYRNTIIIAPPGAGKTTLLRELIRKLSYDGWYVCIADERGELSGMYQGRGAFDLGPRCDVSYGIAKQQAAMMLLRSMCPDVLAMDEITALRDTPAITEAVGCGVGLLTTIHGEGIEAVYKPGFRPISETYAFERAVIISLENGKRKYRVEALT